jgi:predicted HicB family RNase H-like nuclease
MNEMTYRGYTACIDFDDRDQIFWGKVIGIQDSITFEGDTVAKLTEDFHAAIDFYLEDCAAVGKSPQKP